MVRDNGTKRARPARRRMRAVNMRRICPPCVERIRGRKGLEAAREAGKGVVRAPRSDNVIHALPCGRLDAMAARGAAEELLLYRGGLAEARKANPGTGLCGECDPEAGEIRDALNRGGAFLHAGTIQNLKGMGYHLRSELPVSAAPFLSDPSRQPGATSLRMPEGRDHVRLLNKTAFRGAVAASQDSSQRRGRTIDVCASRQDSEGTVYTAVIEVKRLDPAYVNWVFLTRDRPPYDYSVVTKSDRPAGGALRLMMVPRSDAGTGDIYVQRQMIRTLPGDMGPVADHGMEITYDPRVGYRHQGTSLHDAASQVLEGAFGLIVDAVTHQATTGVSCAREYYAPVIVTTANMFTCEYDPDALVPGLLDAPDGALRRVDAVIYHCPHPARTRFPDQIVAARDAGQATLAARWPVVVATVEGLKVLQGRRLFHGADNPF